ncbi:Venom serine protease inhibitor like protein [Argiope bruennichi]|uniref:Venom serine protease inhibitor like protein n=1 Tax=Argiope bruennichi TaxID=94029 RepID=A0A8T0EMG3_ARGBR|nr:Venom serine protease inhibitor like protein [Argiope bruennichi]
MNSRTDQTTFPPNSEFSYTRPTVKPLTFDGQTSWAVFKTQFDIVSSTNGWTDVVKASQLVASLRGSAAEQVSRSPKGPKQDEESSTYNGDPLKDALVPGPFLRHKDITASCKSDEVYSQCHAHCQKNCTNWDRPGLCQHVCLSGCVCKPGLVRDEHGSCISPQECKVFTPGVMKTRIPSCESACNTLCFLEMVPMRGRCDEGKCKCW